MCFTVSLVQTESSAETSLRPDPGEEGPEVQGSPHPVRSIIYDSLQSRASCGVVNSPRLSRGDTEAQERLGALPEAPGPERPGSVLPWERLADHGHGQVWV